MRVYQITITTLLILASSLAPAADVAQKKRVAVLNFDYAPVYASVNSIFGGNQDVGRGMADVLVQKLVQDGTYSLIERKALENVIAEQNFSNSDRADPTTAAKLGRILGVDAIVMGTVTQFGVDDKKRDLGALGNIGGRFGLGGVGREEMHAKVMLTARIVNTDTGEVLAVVNGEGTSSKTTTSLGANGGYLGTAGGVLDMTSQNFSNTIMGEAVKTAVNATARQLEGYAPRITAHKVILEGLVADVNGDQLVLNVGSRAGVKNGDRLAIRREGRPVRDPETGKIIRRFEDQVGEVVVTDVDEKSSLGRFTGTMQPKIGDSVRRPN